LSDILFAKGPKDLPTALALAQEVDSNHERYQFALIYSKNIGDRGQKNEQKHSDKDRNSIMPMQTNNPYSAIPTTKFLAISTTIFLPIPTTKFIANTKSIRIETPTAKHKSGSGTCWVCASIKKTNEWQCKVYRAKTAEDQPLTS